MQLWFIFLFSLPLLSLAQTSSLPQAIITWEARNFFPADYPGKAFVAHNTSLIVAVEGISKNTFVDLSRATIVWHVDEKFYQKGVGLKEIVVPVTKLRGNDYFILVVVTHPTAGTFQNSIRVPVTGHVVVVDFPEPYERVTRGKTYTLRAMPYFFSATSLSDLQFIWTVGSDIQTNSGNNQLHISIPEATPVELLLITSAVQNISTKAEIAKVIKRIRM